MNSPHGQEEDLSVIRPRRTRSGISVCRLGGSNPYPHQNFAGDTK